MRGTKRESLHAVGIGLGHVGVQLGVQVAFGLGHVGVKLVVQLFAGDSWPTHAATPAAPTTPASAGEPASTSQCTATCGGEDQSEINNKIKVPPSLVSKQVPGASPTSRDASSWATPEQGSSPAASHGATVASASAHHQPADGAAASHGNPHGDPLPCDSQSHHNQSESHVVSLIAVKTFLSVAPRSQ